MSRILPSKVRLAAAAVLAVSAVAVCALLVSAHNLQSANKEASISPESRALVRQAIASTGLISVRNSIDSSSQGPRPRGSADGDTAASSARYRLRPLLINKEYDLALLRVDSDAAGNPIPKAFTFPSIEMGDSRKIRLLEDLFIVGFPEKGGSTITVNRGVVEGRDILANWIKTDARVIHGNSGGAAVNSEGRLIGIPTKVVADEQPIDRDGDGFPDDSRRYGAVGFLRPSHLVAEMIAQLNDGNSENQPSPSAPRIAESSTMITVRGIVRSAASGKPVAGAMVGLLPLGESKITENTLLTWGSTNAEGAFKLNRPVPPGRYTLKAKALANQAYSSDVEIGPGAALLIIEMLRSSN